MSSPIGNPYFPTTRWTKVLRLVAADDAAVRNEALSQLCRDYWYPLYAFARRKGRNQEDAEDLTQGFFVHVLEHEVFSLADRTQGTLRTYLLKIFQRYMNDMWDRERAQKRGGGREILPLNLENGEELYSKDLASHDTPELMYDRTWARSLLRAATSALGNEEGKAGRERQFKVLQTFLTPDSVTEQGYDNAGAGLEMTPDAVRQAVSRLRKRFRIALREQIAATLHDPDDERIDEELLALKVALRG